MAKKRTEEVERFTLGTYLKVHRDCKAWTIEEMSQRATQMREEGKAIRLTSAGAISELENPRQREQEADVAPEDVPLLAELYDVDSMLLLSLMPKPHPEAIVLDITKDFAQKPPFVDPKSHGAQYHIPEGRLDKSNVTLVFLTLKPGTRSRIPHMHSGDEILKVEKGRVRVVFPDRGRDCRELRAGMLIHFDSSQNHYVENAAELPERNGDHDAELFIVRRFDIGPRKRRRKRRQKRGRQTASR